MVLTTHVYVVLLPLGAEVTARMEIIKSEERRKGVLLTCSTECRLSDGTIAVEGEATVLIPYKTIDAK